MSHTADGRHADAASDERGASVASIAWGSFLVVAVVVVVSGLYLRPFVDDPTRFPHGVDTPGYIQRSLLVSELGLNALTPFGERPAHPVVTSILRDVGGGAPLDLGRTWPPIFTVAVALAGAALGAGVARERRWVGAALGVGIAVSPFVALTAIGYAPNLLVDLFAVAAVALAVRVRSGGRGAIGMILLIGAAAIAHWLFATLLVALLVAYAAGVAIATWLRREDDGWRDPRRLLLAVGLGAVLGGVLLLASPERPDFIPSTQQATAAGKIERRLPEMALGATIPLAVVGGAVMWASRRPPTTRVLPPLALWALAAPAGLIAWKVFDMTIPHRIVPLALGIPTLIVLGAAATRAWTDTLDGRPERRTWVRVGAVGSAVLVLAATAWLAARGASAWRDPESGFAEAQFEQASIMAAYVETLPPDTQLVVPMNPGVWRPIRALMVTLPVERYLDVKPWRVNFFGDRARFHERLAVRYPDAVAFYLEAYSDQPPLGGRRLGPGVRLLSGPAPGALEIQAVAPSEAGELARLTITSIGTLLVVGLGWAIALTGFPAFVVVCISPAVGVAMLALGGFLAGRMGMPLGGGGGVLVAMAVGLLGGLAALLERRRSGGPDEPEPQPTLASPLWLAPKGGRHLAGDAGVRGE
jgi:hypothetical protein